MSDYLLQQGTRATPQTEQADPAQVVNDAGGYVFEAGDWARLRRWLVIGSEAGSFYTGRRALTAGNVKALRACLAADGPRTVQLIVEVSEGGLAPSNEPALFALAVALSHGDKATRREAAEALPRVARIGTHLFNFVRYAEGQRGWGRTLRWAVGNWYRSQDAASLAYQAIKYQQRDGVSHADLLRLAHPKPPTGDHAEVFGFISGNVGHAQTVDEAGRIHRAASPWRAQDWGEEGPPPAAKTIEGALFARAADGPAITANLVRDYRLPREVLNSEHLNDVRVWRALLEAGMPIGALTRNLATMTRISVFEDTAYRDLVTSQLTDPERLRKGRVHPIALLTALATYASGHSVRGTASWSPNAHVTDALDEAFYLAFANVEATGKRILCAVDVSGSMQHAAGVGGSPLSAAAGACAMALVTLHAEPAADVIGFTTRPYDVGWSRRQRLDDAIAKTTWRGEGTDCSAPLRWALDGGRSYDAVVLYTDNETWAGSIHTHQALRQLRERTGVPVRAVACGMVANEFSVLNPQDPGSLNVVGFDASAPQLISAFAGGQL